jgi:hypothetical protein
MLVATDKGDVVDVSSQTARVSVYIDDFRLEGCLHVGTGAGGQKGRVSDALNDESGFVALTDVTIHETGFSGDTKEPWHCELLILRKGEIKFVIPLD